MQKKSSTPANPPLPHYFTASYLQFKPGICRTKGKAKKILGLNYHPQSLPIIKRYSVPK